MSTPEMLTEGEMVEVLIQNVMKEHGKTREQAEKYVAENVTPAIIKTIVDQTNTIILAAHKDPSIIEKMQGHMMNLGGADLGGNCDGNRIPAEMRAGETDGSEQQ